MQIGPTEVKWIGLKPARGELSKAEKALADAGRVIDAIKAFRERTGQSLREAKDAVDRYRAKAKKE